MAPVRSSEDEAATFEGSARSIAFSCSDRQGARATCLLQIVGDSEYVRLRSAGFDANRTTLLPGRSPDAARFRFLDAKAGVLTETWPRGAEQRLGGILLELRIGEAWRAAAFEETLIDAAPDCQFDPVGVSCRQASSGPRDPKSGLRKLGFSIDDPRERRSRLAQHHRARLGDRI
jgi:hypothetical protein